MNLDEFLTLPREQVRALAPRTVNFQPGGTRRLATMEGVGVGREYFGDWGWNAHRRVVSLLFDLGVNTVFNLALVPGNYRETGSFTNDLLASFRMLGDEKRIACYRQMDVRIRFYGKAAVPELSDILTATEETTRNFGHRTWWFGFSGPEDEGMSWDAIQAAMSARAATWREAVRAYYGEDVPPIEVSIGSSKPRPHYPPLLSERADLYWTAFPNLMLDENQIRTIFWDHRFARATWRADKSGRPTEIEGPELVALYRQPSILGVGRLVGPFWHPCE
jgi:hypothetical protein